MLFSGCGVALVTPYTKDGLDLPALRTLITWQRESGTDALIALGTTGESCLLSDREKDAVLACAAECAQEMPLIAGCGATDTATAIHRAKAGQRLGASALLAVTPYYLRTSQEGLYAHYMRLADVCRVPLILYNVPARTGMDLLPETVARLSEHPMIRGLKEAGTDAARVGSIVRLTNASFAVYSGNDDTAVWAMAAGARGVISVAANVEPVKMAKMSHLALAGDFARASALQRELTPLIRALFAEPNPIPVKCALAMMGKLREHYRLPLCAPSQAHREELSKILLDL